MKKRLLIGASLTAVSILLCSCSDAKETSATTAEITKEETTAASEEISESETEETEDTEETEASEETVAKDPEMYRAYYDFVSDPGSYEWDGTTIYFDDYNWDSFILEDIDGDGSEELIATNLDPDRFESSMQYYLVVGYYDGSLRISELRDGVASAGGYRGTVSYLPGEGVIYDDWISAPDGNPGFTYYKLENGEVLNEGGGYLEPDQDYEYPESFENGTWTWGALVVTEEEFNDYVKEITKDDSGIPLSSIGYISQAQMLDELQKMIG